MAVQDFHKRPIEELERKLNRARTRTNLFYDRVKHGMKVSESQEVLKARRLLNNKLTERNSKLNFEHPKDEKSSKNYVLPRIQGTKPNAVGERWIRGQKNTNDNTNTRENTFFDYDQYTKERAKEKSSCDVFGAMWNHPSVTRRILRQLDEASISPRDRTYHWLLYQTE